MSVPTLGGSRARVGHQMGAGRMGGGVALPGLRECVHGGIFVFEDEGLACVSTRRYWRAFVCQLRVTVSVCVCVCVCVCVRGGTGRGTANQNQYSQVPAVPRLSLPPSAA